MTISIGATTKVTPIALVRVSRLKKLSKNTNNICSILLP